jgi:hypothetical protein
MLQVLEEDFARIPGLLGRAGEPPPVLHVVEAPPEHHPEQLGLF